MCARVCVGVYVYVYVYVYVCMYVCFNKRVSSLMQATREYLHSCKTWWRLTHHLSHDSLATWKVIQERDVVETSGQS